MTNLKKTIDYLGSITDLLHVWYLKQSTVLKKYHNERHGSDYGGWIICPTSLTKRSIIYSLGIGEDISWDEELIAKYDVEIFGFDPTPKSAVYVQQKNLRNFNFFQIGVADHDGLLKFYPPKNRDYVSCSLFKQQELQDEPLLVKIMTLDTIMRNLGHERIDILKMDIEGAEYGVVEDIMKKSIFPHQILVEFHHRFNPFSIADTKKAIHNLINNGYDIFYISDNFQEFSFIYNGKEL